MRSICRRTTNVRNGSSFPQLKVPGSLFPELSAATARPTVGAITTRAKLHLISYVVVHNGGRKQDQRPFATVAASVTGDAILQERREHVAREARALEACYGSPQSADERDFWQGGSRMRAPRLRCIYWRGD